MRNRSAGIQSAWLKVLVLFVACVTRAEFRRLRSVDKEMDNMNPMLNSVEFIWGTTTVAVGDTAVLHCSFDAIFQQLRTGNIDWVKEEPGRTADDVIETKPSTQPVRIASGKQMTIDDRRYRVYRPHNSALSVLIIRRARRQDAGIYRCNLAGSSTRHKYMILNVTESKIEAQTSPAKTVAKVGTDVTLWCNATGYPKPVVYWTREDRNRKLPDGNQQFWGNELHFDKVTEADTGIYTCYLDNFVQPVVSYKFSLMVEDNPWNVEGSKMRFDSSQWYRQDSAEPRPVRGKSYLLLCETRGSPKPLPTIQWYRDGRPLRNSKHFYIIEDTPEWRSSYTSSTLVIMRFMNEFQGNYTCVASNAFRMKKQTFYLTETLAVPDTPSNVDTTPARVRNNNRRRGGNAGAAGAAAGRPPLRNNIPGSNLPPAVNNNNNKELTMEETKSHVRQASEERNKLLAAVSPVANDNNSTASRLASPRQRGPPQTTAATGSQSPLGGATAAGNEKQRVQPLLPRLPPELATPPSYDDEDDSAGKASGNGNEDDD